MTASFWIWMAVLAFLFLFLFPTFILSGVLYTVLLVRKTPDKWGRECSIPDDEEYVGMYLSSHPLDRYRFEIDTFTDCQLAKLQARIDECEGKDKAGKAAVAGIVTDVKTLTTRNGSQGARVTVEDYSGTFEFALFAFTAA